MADEKADLAHVDQRYNTTRLLPCYQHQTSADYLTVLTSMTKKMLVKDEALVNSL